MPANDNTELQKVITEIVEKDKAAGWILKGERPKKSRVKNILSQVGCSHKNIFRIDESHTICMDCKEVFGESPVEVAYNPEDFKPVFE